MAVCTDNTVQCSLCSRCSLLIILQWSIRVLMHATRSWGSSPSLATISSNSPRHTWVLTSCVIPCWIRSRKTEALALVTFCSSLLPVGIHCACISRDLVPRAAKTYLRWSSAVWQYAVEEEPVLQGMAEIWRRSGMHLGSSSHRQAGLWRLS